ncbi:MAG: PQQ-binding-like beta-propeller repeat protein [Halobacteriaceae archaeon]
MSDPTERPSVSRRAVLVGSGLAASATLAGCSVLGDGGQQLRAPTCEGTASLGAAAEPSGAETWPQPWGDGAKTAHRRNNGPSTLDTRWTVTPVQLDDWPGTAEFPAFAGTTHPPVVTEDAVYVSARTGLHAVDAATGEHRWFLDVSLAADGPLLLAGSTIVGMRASPDHETVTGLVGIDASSRTVAWRNEVVPTGPPAADGDTLFVPTRDGLRRVEAANGERRGDPVTGPSGDVPGGRDIQPLLGWGPTVGDGVCYGRTGQTVYAVDATTGERRWTHDLPTSVEGRRVYYLGPPTVEGGRCFVVRQWDVNGLPDDAGRNAGQVPGGTTMAPTRGRLADWHGSVFAIDAASGDRLWRYDLDGTMLSPVLCAAGGAVFVGGMYDSRVREATEDVGVVAAIDAADGCLRWEHRLGTGVGCFLGVTGAGGKLYGVTSEPYKPGPDEAGLESLFVLDAGDGELLDAVSLSETQVASEDTDQHSPVAVANGRAVLFVDGLAGFGT